MQLAIKLFSPKTALASAWAWFIGMIFFSGGMHWLGLVGAPRRVPFSTATYSLPSWQIPQILTAIGGTILFIASILYFISILGTIFSKNRGVGEEIIPIAEAEVAPSHTPAWLDAWKTWIALSIILVIIGYGPVLIQMFMNINLYSPGFKLY